MLWRPLATVREGRKSKGGGRTCQFRFWIRDERNDMKGFSKRDVAADRRMDCVLTSSLRQPLGSLPVPDGSVNQKQRSEISSLLEALLGEIDLPGRESLVSDDLPLGF